MSTRRPFLIATLLLGGGLLAGGGALWAAARAPGVDHPVAPSALLSTVVEPAAARPAPPPAAEWREVATLTDAGDLIHSVAYAPDGKTFAAGTAGGVMVVWDAAERKELWKAGQDLIRNPNPIPLAYSPAHSWLAQGTAQGAELLNAATGKAIGLNNRPAVAPKANQLDGPAPLAIAFGPTSMVQEFQQHRLAFTDGRTLTAKTWIEGGQPATSTFGPTGEAPKLTGGPYAGVEYSPDGRQLVFIPNNRIDPAWAAGTSTDRTPDPKKATHWFAQVWGAGSGAGMHLLAHGTDPVTAVAWAPKGDRLATGGKDGRVVLWDAATFRPATTVHIGGRGGKSTIHALKFSPDGRELAAALEFDEGKNPRRVVLIDPASGKRRQDLQFFWKSPASSLAYSPDGKVLIVGCGHLDAAERKGVTPEERGKAGEVRVFTTEPEAPPAEKKDDQGGG